MFIEVTRSQAVEILRTGRTLWCLETGEGWQLGDPTSWSKRALRRFIARHYSDARDWSGQNVIHFRYNPDWDE